MLNSAITRTWSVIFCHNYNSNQNFAKDLSFKLEDGDSELLVGDSMHSREVEGEENKTQGKKGDFL